MDSFDLIIIGSGSGNSIPEHLDGWRIAVVERSVFGGTCLNVGCIPSKMFVLPADRAVEAESSAHLGISTRFDGADFATIRDRVFGRIDAIAGGGEEYRANGNPNIELIRGTARFSGPKQIDVDGRQITGDRILIAAGARPWVPPIPGLESVGYHTSDTVMRLDALPSRLGVIGGGFIAAELGHVFSGLGSDVVLFNRSGRLLRDHDAEVSQRFTEVFGRRVDLRLNELPTRIERTPTGIRMTCDEGEIEVDELLVATGRTPNVDLLNLEAGGVEVADGLIVTDDTMATTADGVWAAGDITNRHQLKHLANREAEIAFWNLANPDQLRRIDRRVLPHAVFGHPQIGAVGLTEGEARQAGHDFVVGRRDYGGTAYGWALEDTESFAKVLIDRPTGSILGAHIIGIQAASLIQLVAQAMAFGQTAEQLARDVFYVHPAPTEVVENALLDGLEHLKTGL